MSDLCRSLPKCFWCWRHQTHGTYTSHFKYLLLRLSSRAFSTNFRIDWHCNSIDAPVKTMICSGGGGGGGVSTFHKNLAELMVPRHKFLDLHLLGAMHVTVSLQLVDSRWVYGTLKVSYDFNEKSTEVAIRVSVRIWEMAFLFKMLEN